MKMKIALLMLLLFLFVPTTTFAKEIHIQGKILDSLTNPVAQGVVVFIDKAGKTAAAATSDTSGMYQASVVNGVYTIQVSGPVGSKLSKVSTNDQTISSDSTRNFTLAAPSVVQVAKKEKPRSPFITLRILFVLILLVILGIVLWRFREKK